MNVRFWHFANDDWVKVTLKEGQKLIHTRGEWHDEGWWHRETEFSFDGTDLSRIEFSDVIDCYGRLSSGSESVCHRSGTRKIPCYIGSKGGIDGYSNDMFRPDWENINSFQRDYEAEKANY